MHGLRSRECSHALQKNRIARKLTKIKFRIAPGQPNDIGRRVGRFVRERRERRDLGSGSAPRPQHVRINEGKGTVAGKRDALPRRNDRRRGAPAGRVGRQGSRRRRERVEVERRFRHIRQFVEPRGKALHLRCLHKAEMTLGKSEAVAPKNRAEDWDPCFFHSIPRQPFVPRARDAIQDDARNLHALPKTGKTSRHGGGALRLP
jgi:hypothetical protein